jgi:hypothetical protein
VLQAECLVMMTFTSLPSVPSDHPVPFTDQLRLAVAAYLARFKGASRYHTESDLRCYLAWYAERGLDPLTARRPHLELYIRCMHGHALNGMHGHALNGMHSLCDMDSHPGALARGIRMRADTARHGEIRGPGPD